MKKIFDAGLKLLLSFSMLATAQSAFALTTGSVVGSNFVNGQSSYSTSFADGTTATFVGSTLFRKKPRLGSLVWVLPVAEQMTKLILVKH